MKNNTIKNNYISEIGIGLVLLGLGSLIYKLFPVFEPFFESILNWQLLIIIMGIIRGINKNFKGNDWWIITALGIFLWLANLNIISYSIRHFLFPIIIIILGVKLILNQRKKQNKILQKKIEDGNETTVSDDPILPFANEQQEEYTSSHLNDTTLIPEENPSTNNKENRDDHVFLDTVFGNNKKLILSKNFKGGNVSSIFGSTEIILTHADIQHEAKLDLFTLCGDIKIIVPKEFNIINNMTSVLANVDDKRNFMTENLGQKNLYINGQAILGNVVFKNF
jgi:predicted membrane protein